MAFILKQSDSYSWPVTVEMPAASGKPGQTIKSKFDAEFLRLSQSRVNDLVEGGKAGDITDKDVCLEIVCGWSGITDGEDEVPFSDAAFARLLDITGVQRGILTAWFESLGGAQRKN